MEETEFKHFHLHGDEVVPVKSYAEPEPEWTPEEEKAVRRKLDYRIVPVVTLLYLLCFIDRANIGNARIMGMREDLALVGYRFNWALSIFYVTYMLVEIPSNIILKKVGPRFWIPFLVGGFGLVSICTAFVKSWSQLMVARAFLGIFEGGTMPGIAFFLSCFYRREELLFRIGIFVSGSSMAGAFGGLLATGLSSIPRWGVAATPIYRWRNIFFFEGLFTVLVSLAAPFFMPTRPEDCFFLNARERMIAAERLVREHKANPHENVKMHHVKRAVFNINNLVCCGGFFLINITVQSFSLFLPTILNDLGWTATRAQLYSVPPYVCAATISILIAFISDKTRLRGVYLAGFSILTIIGFAILRTSGSANIKYMAVFFSAIGAFPGGPGFLAWGLNNSAGPAVRAVTGAYIVSIGTLGAIVATWTYIVTDAPLYHTGHSINIGAQAAVFVLVCGGVAYIVYENKLRARGGRDHRLKENMTHQEEADLGYRHPEFRYIP
ncbi:hypothetical protein W97_06691 [Coniosporium apollinis CBS 100218]|uniref:Major facilitator superfamily (MFS) profile domain-containing protein n=1 Tax=Coniosporium apollinis (strain CBS 100218) TaxID=1168221 RepID=R7YZV7_CONA1|nr:uncharacterized protein W97_06691 [Coniosporium apollinis CBS 100218]EON67437.1 hypothetical protein W97_06691 [Coniosporium apollinis CBS 100218]